MTYKYLGIQLIDGQKSAAAGATRSSNRGLSNTPPLQGGTAYPPGFEPAWDSGGPTNPGEYQAKRAVKL